ncbi:hypothetical protein [Halopiger xanaduensis]|uniref:Uncharacterized protein n=1 Tax=Halopiger xanaduensis (strain DSM 18323 / JCM 14033 / SH-6) TaxID=797210 RepID=F8D825_HALXS|nr:hypothetical protein [Halopiger xanaduensis]AEH37917.1 hypothetical protein Halxa_3305 [Halopiger xanaduensis SH-6]
MPSTTVSRRRLLAVGSGCLSLAIAGCAGESESESTVEGKGSDEPTGESTVESTHEYESLFVRSDGDGHFIYRDEERANEAAETSDADGASSRPYIRSPLFVVDEDDADALRIETDATRADEIRAFVAETDFESESIVIDQRTIEDCYRRHIEGIRAGGSFHTDYCQSLKGPMTPCEAGKEVMEAVILRVHRPYNEAPSSRSSSESHSCPGSIAARDRTRNEGEEEDDDE